jgi:hypothetical protein
VPGFVWKGEEEVNGGHCLLPWNRVCMPTQFGGLGVFNLKLFGTALRCRWPWLDWSPPPRPWSLVPGEDDEEAQTLFKAGAFIQLGDGQSARFWTDNWLPEGRSVRDTVPVLFSFVQDSKISVAAAFDRHRWVRDIRGGLSLQAMAQYLRLWDLVQPIILNTVADPGQKLTGGLE